LSLAKYKQKRNFKKTPEPMGGKPSPGGKLSYVIQKHAASHLHYDFRLELNGVLLSWAVPKGPSLDPSVKRLAMHVEDHPLDYGKFEGIIPQGEYGGGTVLLWDRGFWIPEGNPAADYKAGKLKFKLKGEKLKGGWTLLRMRSRNPKYNDKSWLLIKEEDKEAKPETEYKITEKKPLSVVSGKDIPAIAKNPQAVHSSNAKRKQTPLKKNPREQKDTSEIEGAKKSPLPSIIHPQLAQLVETAPEGNEWVHEIKFDGYRILTKIDGKKITMFTRNENDWTDRFPHLAKELSQLPVKSAWLDGEVVVLNEEGHSSFQALQQAFDEKKYKKIQYYLFDLIYLDGVSLFGVDLITRKEKLREILSSIDSPLLHFSDHIEGKGGKFFTNACEYKLEGIISKRKDSHYISSRTSAWVKTKCMHDEEYIIVGYTEPRGSREGFGAILLGIYDDNHELKYSGKVGTGFSNKDLERYKKQFDKCLAPKSLLKNPPREKYVTWLKPKLVAQIHYAEKTEEGLLRHASFLGLREDKPAEEVSERTEKPMKTSKAVKKISKAGSKGTEVAGIKLTHPDKVLYTKQNITKLELARFYEGIEEWILPELIRRPIMLKRCPEGESEPCFYQKHANETFPNAVKSVPIAEKIQSKETKDYIYIDDLQGLIALVQAGALELHTWGSQVDQLEFPDRMVFDLDPAEGLPWPKVIQAAKTLRNKLKELKLESFLKTTGGKGLHLVVPLSPLYPWETVKAFSKLIVDSMMEDEPRLYVTKMTKNLRTNKIFLDYLRNSRGSTFIAPYSTRAREGATVATPLDWNELDSKIRSDTFTVKNLKKRLDSLKRDPWEKIYKLHQKLPKAFTEEIMPLPRNYLKASS
jgi:bifunctional non-homologous end joining protein LigD